MNEGAEFIPPPPEVLDAVRKDAERLLSREELDAYVNAPMSREELEGIRELIDWFTRRYPTAAERLAYVRRAYARRALSPRFRKPER
jgi:hypothetical protein